MSAFLASFSRVFATRHAGRGFSHSWGLGRTRELSMSEYAGVLVALGQIQSSTWLYDDDLDAPAASAPLPRRSQAA